MNHRMKVREVMERTGLTRKALYYYEELGIVTPAQDPQNGYREYSEEDVHTLLLVAGLHQLGVSAGEISSRMEQPGMLDEDSTAEILKQRKQSIDSAVQELERQKSLISACIGPAGRGLVERLTVAARAEMIDDRGRANFMKRQLIKAFPGNFGRAMSAIFSPFLDEPVDTPEKERAWLSLIEAIDEFDPVVLPESIQNLSQGLELCDLTDDSSPIFQKALSLNDAAAKTAVRTADYLVHHAGAFLEPFFEFLDVLSSRFQTARTALIEIARELEVDAGE